MSLKDKTRISVKKNVYLSLCAAIVCLVFSMFALAGSTWAWFSVEYESSGNTIAIGDYVVNLSFQKLNKSDSGKKLLMASSNTGKDNAVAHEIVIEENGDYRVRIKPVEEISGYCNLTISDEEGNSLLDKESLVVKIDKDEDLIFNVHTNKYLKISISNINWGSLVEYDELEEDYNFADFKFVYKNGTVEENILPEGYKELSYIDSNGEQYTEDIVVGGKTIINKGSFGFPIEKQDVIDEDGKTVAYVYPCVDQKGLGGLYIYDLTNDSEKFYPNIGEGNFKLGEEVKHYNYLLANGDGNTDFNYKDVVVSGVMENDETIYSYGTPTEDRFKECAYAMEGFHFVGWKYEDSIVESINNVLTTIDPTSEQEIVLEAVWEIDHKVLVIEGETTDIKYRQELPQITNIPSEEGYTFKGYYLADELIIDANGNFVKDPFDWSNSEEYEIVLEARWVVSVDKVEEKEISEETDDIDAVEEETNEVDSSVGTAVIEEEDNTEVTNKEIDTSANGDEQGGTNE